MSWSRPRTKISNSAHLRRGRCCCCCFPTCLLEGTNSGWRRPSRRPRLHSSSYHCSTGLPFKTRTCNESGSHFKSQRGQLCPPLFSFSLSFRSRSAGGICRRGGSERSIQPLSPHGALCALLTATTTKHHFLMLAYDTGILILVWSLDCRGAGGRGRQTLRHLLPTLLPQRAAPLTVFFYTGRLPPVLPNTDPITEGAREREPQTPSERASAACCCLGVGLNLCGVWRQQSSVGCGAERRRRRCVLWCFSMLSVVDSLQGRPRSPTATGAQP